ncbi:uncharacterized protein LOC117301380 [Asterias rubens]|uniref:uncharacterized protein LOC117301380 n=1 Tax=Asterias rubens TaxID=7604 RepID=UPI001454F4E3|nr:uncharacterized protein LOC117301380 [Asterias rubens]
MSAQHEHTRNLEKLCRVCGNAIRKWKNKSKKNKRCSAYSEKIQVKYGINIQADEHHRHPSQICHLCYSNLFLPKPHHPPNEWPPHPERGTCTVCAKVDEVKTGRPAAKYARLERLDTDEATAKEVVSQHFNTLAETTTIFVRDNFTTDESSICCQICSQILNRPVETQCHHIFCLDCLQVVFNRSSSSSVLCPSCHKHTSLKDTSPVREYFLNILGNAKVTCRTCNRSSWLNSTSSHDCKDPLTSQHIDEHIFRDLIKRNMSASGKLGQQVTSTLLKQQIQSDGGTVRLSTGGKAMYVQRITHPRKSSDDVSKRTLFRRTKLVKDKLQEVSGNKATEQLSHMLRTATRHDLQHLLKKIKFTTYIPPLEELALKSDISLSWAALRELKLWLRQYNIIMANEQTTRKVSQMSVGQDILEGERLPFVANDHGSLVSKPAPCVFITDLKKYVLGLLDDYERCGKLQWTEGMPKEEIWLKLGGDKGGGSFKMMLEVANIANPNSRRDTSVICVYESSDTAPNLHIALEKYKEQVESISNTSWRGKKLVVFLFGDYEFLCRMYGLSGPSGK